MSGGRQANGRSSIYQDAQGRWHGRVTVGPGPDGRPDRRHVRGRTRTEVSQKVKELEAQRAGGLVTDTARTPTLEVWLRHWLELVAAPRIKPSSYASYETDVRVHLVPLLGGHRLDGLRPEHVDAALATMTRRGSSAGTVQHVRRTLRAALNEAVARGHLGRNPVLRATGPRLDAAEITPLSITEARAVLAAASGWPNGAAFVIALSLGLRRGEVLALRWSDVDLDASTLTVRRSVQRLPWRHGCGDPRACAAGRHTRRCGRTCAGHPLHCPQRHGGGLVFDSAKSRAGHRTVPLPASVRAALVDHRREQTAARLRSGSRWQDGDLVFTGEYGTPVDPDGHSKAWKALLAKAGVREARLHDARHSAATYLLVQGVDQRTVMDMLGWSQLSMTQRYQHVVPELTVEASRRIEQLLWSPNAATS